MFQKGGAKLKLMAAQLKRKLDKIHVHTFLGYP
jgi:hypothetical protein